MVYVRRTDAEGRAEVLGRTFEVDQRWAHRLVRAEVDLGTETGTRGTETGTGRKPGRD